MQIERFTQDLAPQGVAEKWTISFSTRSTRLTSLGTEISICHYTQHSHECNITVAVIRANSVNDLSASSSTINARFLPKFGVTGLARKFLSPNVVWSGT